MMKEKIGDSKLVSLYLKGNEEAFGMLINRYKAKVFTTIHIIVKDRCIAEDLLQDTFIKVVNTLKSGNYNEKGSFRPWLMRIAHNLAIDYFRKEKRNPTYFLEEGSNHIQALGFSQSSEQLQITKDTCDQLKKLIDELPDVQREVVVMRHYMQLSFQEIAEQTGVSINTALGRMRYALINLRKKLKQIDIAYDENIYPK